MHIHTVLMYICVCTVCTCIYLTVTYLAPSRVKGVIANKDSLIFFDLKFVLSNNLVCTLFMYIYLYCTVTCLYESLLTSI